MRKIVATAALVALAGTMVGCATTENPEFDETTVNYNGRDLDCVTWYGSHQEVGLTCDFVKYHKENGDDSEVQD